MHEKIIASHQTFDEHRTLQSPCMMTPSSVEKRMLWHFSPTIFKDSVYQCVLMIGNY